MTWGKCSPKTTFAALNVRGGESGLLGEEEAEIIAPAISEARRAGIDVSRSYAADTIIMCAIKGEFDYFVWIHRDQTNISREIIAGIGVTLLMGPPV